MKVLFVDIDGVLVTARSLSSSGHQPLSDGFNAFDPDAVTYLNEVVRLTGVKIVVTSTWRANGFIRLSRIMESRGVLIHDVTPIGHEFKDRGEEISAWVGTHRPKDCAIIDDREVLGHEGRVVIVDRKLGITMAAASEVVKILNRKP